MLPHQVFVDSSSLRITLLGAMALASCAPARGQDVQTNGSNAAAHSQTVSRIFASWRARQVRTKSFHFAWDTYTARHGEAVNNDESQTPPSHYECWVGRDDRYRFEASTVLPSKAKGSQRHNHEWITFDGKIYSVLRWTEGSTLPARGKLWSFLQKAPDFLNDKLRALQLVFRGDRRPEQYRLITEDAILNGVRCIKLQSSGKPGDSIESVWVDPRQDDALVLWEVLGPGPGWPAVSLQYRKDKENGWIPIQWRVDNPDGNSLDLVSKVQTFAINEALPADRFQIRFPPRTGLSVDFEGKSQEQYIVKPDGSKELAFNLQSIQSPRLRNVLEQRLNFPIDQIPLRQAINRFNAMYNVPIVIDARAFRDAKIDVSIEVSEEILGISLWEALGWLSAQCPRPFGIVERDGQLVLTHLLPRIPAAPAKSQPAPKPKPR